MSPDDTRILSTEPPRDDVGGAAPASDPIADTVTELGNALLPDAFELEPNVWVYGGMPSADILDRPFNVSMCGGGKAKTDAGWSTFAYINSKARARSNPPEPALESYQFREFLNEVLTEHRQYPIKDKAMAFLQGIAIEGTRKANSMQELCLLGLDMDTGQTQEEFRARVREHNLFCVTYTTFSNGKASTLCNADQVAKWAGKAVSGVTEGDVLRYLREVRLYLPRVLVNARKEPKTVHKKEGVMFLVHHAPMEKFRAVFKLDRPYVIGDHLEGQKAALTEWSDRYRGFAKVLGAYADGACVDVSRLFFFPSHAPGATNWRVEVIAGKPLVLTEFPRVKASSHRREEADPYADAAADLGAKKSGTDFKTTNLDTFAGRYGVHFDVVEFLVEHGYKDRGSALDGAGRTLACPFEGDHTAPANGLDMGFCAKSGDGEKGFVLLCRHAGCIARTGEDRLAYLDQTCQDAGITDALDRECENGPMRFVPSEVWQEEDTKDHGPEMTEEDLAHINDGIPTGYENREANGGWGLYFDPPQKDKVKPPPVKIGGPIRVIGYTNDEKSENCGKVYRWWHRNTGKPVELEIGDANALSSPGSVVAMLASKGYLVDGADQSKAKLFTCFSRMTSKKVIIAASTPGWYGDRYVSPIGETFGPNPDNLILTPGVGTEDRKRSGGLFGWQVAIDTALSVKENWPWGVAVMLGLAGPLVGLLDIDNVGICWTGKSTMGKTTAQQLQASTVANVRAGTGVLHTLRMTSNSYENLALNASGASLALDELANLESKKTLQQLIFGLAGGTTKARQKAEGSLRTVKQWRLTFSVSNEFALGSEIEAAGERLREGTKVRLLDLSVSRNVMVDPEKMSRIKEIKQHYGHAVPALVEHLIEKGLAADPEPLKARWKELTDKLVGEGAQPILRRAGEVLATCWLAGELGQECDLLPTTDRYDVAAAIMAAWQSYIEGTGSSLKDPVADALSQIEKAIALTWGRDIAECDGNHFTTPSAFYDKTFIYIPDGNMVKVTGLNMKEDEIIQLLDKAGKLVWQKDHSTRVHRHIPDESPMKHHRLRVADWRTKVGAPDAVCEEA